MMTRDEAKEFIAECIDDTLELINYKLSMDADMEFADIEEMIDEVWTAMREEKK